MKAINIKQLMQNDVAKGIVGIMATIAAITTSFITEIIPWLQAISLLVGMAVGVATIWSIIKSNRRKDAGDSD